MARTCLQPQVHEKKTAGWIDMCMLPGVWNAMCLEGGRQGGKAFASWEGVGNMCLQGGLVASGRLQIHWMRKKLQVAGCLHCDL